jgi:long-chain acyl-CoA synthetase
VIATGAEYEALAAAPPMPDAGRGGGDLAAIYFTGGTTGRPKGVMLSHGNLGANALTSVHVLEMDERTVHLVAQPLFHLSGGARVFATTLAMGRHAFPAPRFDADDVAETIRREGVTHAAFVPTMVTMLLERRAADLASLRLLAYGSAPMPETLLRRALAA